MRIHETIAREISRSAGGVSKEARTSAAKGRERRALYSELRTVYETTAADPHTFRQTFKLKDMIDGKLLRKAVNKTMARYPYFQVRLIADGKDELCFVYNPARIPLGTKHQGLVDKWDRPALQLLDAGITHPIPDSVVYNMRIPEKDFMRFNFASVQNRGGWRVSNVALVA